MAKDTMHVVAKLYTDGRVEEVEESLTLTQLQAFVGGSIELVPTVQAHRVLLVNEEGLLQGLPRNDAATRLARPGVLMVGGIRGDALVVKR